MRVRFGLVVAAPLLGVSAWGGVAAQAADVAPVLRRVTLSSGGVGQFEFTAHAEGAGTIDLDVPLDQVDDLLKSLRVDDPAGPPNIRLPGRQPLAESFRTLPFGPDAFASPKALLSALVGEWVSLSAPGIEGTILAVTDVETALPNNGGTLTRHRLTIATATGIESVMLEEAQGIAFSSEVLRRQIGAALAAIAAQRVQDRRTMHVALAQGGATGSGRDVRLGYVVPAPVWKASYRLTIPARNTDAPARLQGFAVVENLSGRPWRDVQVVLTSGQPVLFHSPLYEAVFTARPDAPVEVANRLVPKLDEGAMAADAPGGAAEQRTRALAPLPAPAMAPMARMMAAPAASEPMAPPPEPEPPSSARQSATQVEFTLATPVTAEPGESLMLPIVARDIPARRVALYQPGTDPRHPLVALLLTNDTGAALPPGLITLFEQQTGGVTGFLGDARLPAVQPGEERMASFAADLAVRVDMTQGADVVVTGAQAAGGVLTLLRKERATTTYRTALPADSGRTLVFETPRRPGWTLAEPADAATTPDGYRITRVAAAGSTATLAVTLERPLSQRIVLGDAAPTVLAALAQQGGLPAAAKASLTRAAELRQELDRRNVVLKGLRDRRAAVVADQERVRSNLKAVPDNSELQRRYLAQLRQQEDDLAALGKQADAAQTAVTEAEGTLKTYIAGITL